MIPSGDLLRWCSAASLILLYAAMCSAIRFAYLRRQHAANARNANPGQIPAWIIAYASQTGTAEDLAMHTAATLRLAGIPVRTCVLSSLTLPDLAAATRILFVVSTYGEGDPPDNAARFVSRVMSTAPGLPELHYGILTLGDRNYLRFCAFGAALERWLLAQGAQPLFARIEVDRQASPAIDAWRTQILHLAGTSDLPDWDGAEYTDWKLVERRVLNDGSAGEAVTHIELEPVDGRLPDWESGDLVQVLAPGDAQRAREYSIASIPADGRIHLLVRLQRHDDGSTGIASGWLGNQAAPGESIALRLRSHRRFQLGANRDRPLILIGNGTGIAGLRSHLKARARSGARPNWLIFGERNIASDFHYRDEIEQWQADGVLTHADLAFSRDQAQRRYVQHCIGEHADRVREWVRNDAAIYVCGSIRGMAEGVDNALAQVLGVDMLEHLAATGRYRRDVY